jgi:hypothetical protein
MTGQIPKYGQNFKLEHVDGYHPTLSHSAYVLKRDSKWFIRSDKASKRWQIFHGEVRDTAAPVGKVHPSLTKAMKKMIDGIDGGFYAISGDEYQVIERSYSWGTVVELIKNGMTVTFVDVYNDGTYAVSDVR